GNIYGATFFMATGFHGAHVIIGSIFLIVCLARAYAGHFTPKQHLGFEFAAWYWHFVDVVWLFLFACIYVWGSGHPAGHGGCRVLPVRRTKCGTGGAGWQGGPGFHPGYEPRAGRGGAGRPFALGRRRGPRHCRTDPPVSWSTPAACTSSTAPRRD